MLDHLYALVAGARRRRFERRPETRRRLERPVISVGNLSVGGTGKTPLVMGLARWLLAEGERPAVLSRGYARTDARDGVVVVSDGDAVLASIATAGDEPLLMASEVPGAIVCVSEDRWLAGVLAERRLGATVHLLDDGFQHVQLARDLDILVTAPGEIVNGRVLPVGRLREHRMAAARAHVAVVVGADAPAAREEAWTLGISQAVGARRTPGVPRVVHASPGAAPDVLALRDAGTPVVAVAGIARPERFFDEVRDGGWSIGRALPFADHHAYTARDLGTIGAALGETGAALVLTTEKDAVRLLAAGPPAWPVAVAPLTITCEPEGALEATVAAALDRARERAARQAPWPALAPPPAAGAPS
ncbi:MAG: tetraacyldisaccharide 4'-kinase [Vicinamibacterales bacterium]